MGCTNSNIRKINHQDIQVEERIIQAAENLLVFKRKKIEEVFIIIDSISFPLNSDHLDQLCDTFKISHDSSTGHFFSSWLTQKPADRNQLKLLTILVSEAEGSIKLPLITSNDKDTFLATITELVRLSFEVIPQNLHNVDTSSLLYADGLKNAAQEFLDQLKNLELIEIKKIFEEIEISSKEIRYKLMVESKKVQYFQKIDLKNDYFKKQEGEEQTETLVPDLEEKNEGLSKKENQFDSQKLKNDENFALVKCEKIEENHSVDGKNGLTDETGLDLKSFLEKIPSEHPVDFTFSDESRSVVINEESASSFSKKEDKIVSEELEKEKIKPPDSPVKSPEPDDQPRRLSAVDLYIQKCKETKKNPENDEKSDSKIPAKSKILTKIKSVTSISKPEMRAKQESEDLKTTQIKSPKSSIHPPSKLSSPKEFEHSSANRGDINLGESELLRSRTSKKSEGKLFVSDTKKEDKLDQKTNFEEKKGKLEDHKNEDKKESKIGSIKEKVLPDDHETKPTIGRRNSKIGTIKNKK